MLGFRSLGSTSGIGRVYGLRASDFKAVGCPCFFFEVFFWLGERGWLSPANTDVARTEEPQENS